MIGMVGDIVGGTHVFDSVAVDLPTDSQVQTDYVLSVSVGASVSLPTDTATQTDYAPVIALVVALDLPTDNLTLVEYAPNASGGANVSLPTDTASQTDYSPTIAVIIDGVPKFYVNRSGSTVTITFTNRDSKEVQIFRSLQHNGVFSSLAFASSDTYSDSIGTDNYKYKVRFVSRVDGSINAAGQKSISKFTKS